MTLRLLDLFSGIGGFSLGLERSGAFRTVAFCEIDPYCRRVLAKHWPQVPCYDDVRILTAERLKADGIGVDAICGGFPCQDISTAGKGAGITGERSGLWSEYARIIGELRPRYVIVENVAALLGRGLDRVLGDLAALGFDAEWHCIPASAVGAPHRRDRIWIVAHATSPLAYADCSGGAKRQSAAAAVGHGHTTGTEGCHVANADNRRLAMRGFSEALADCLFNGRHSGGRDPWESESGFRRVAHGVPARVDRLRSLGNAVVPQIPELIGRAIARAAA